MTKVLILAVALGTALTAPDVHAAIMVPPETPPPPAVSPQQAEAAREFQQADAPAVENGFAVPDSTDRYDKKGKAEATASSSVFNKAVKAQQEAASSANRGGHAGQKSSSPQRTRGAILMITGAAGMVGLGIGRVMLNGLSRTTRREAEEAMADTPSTDVHSRDLGGDHREYIID